ncbi:bifunctional DNA-binding transcriptional regulator/O6-methylguanine-DNA methyltransferase Ada [Desulfacinum hydrothermale]|nr:bifunctional DNA-binding transcriptional regulator/O6-methylguanine-DNA methyltransferase Ada [Desulfacinum hydrothermale]
MQAFSTDEAKWKAVAARDVRGDGVFVYGVLTTGVRCRPSCASRRPKRENVRFFDSWQDAKRAGFRACKKCRPDRTGADPAAERVRRICRVLEQCEDLPILKDLAALAGCSPSHLQRTFKRLLGLTPRQYALQVRRARIQVQLGRAGSVTEAIHRAGYGSSSRFYEKDAKALGMAPKIYRKGAPHQEIRFAVAPCGLGWVLVAATARGVCAVWLGDDAKSLEGELLERFPRARILPAEPDQQVLVQKVVAHLEAPWQSPPDLPLDIQATAFEQRVWEALRHIPPGTTATYAEIARKIEKPSAARAVARACASNPAAVVIPCHRVVRSDGGLAGYRWGLERKERLLQLERQGAERLERKNEQAEPCPAQGEGTVERSQGGAPQGPRIPLRR